ncbi:MAG: Lrp/AsnC family transcriptional regulator [Thermoplasmatota archaeon]
MLDELDRQLLHLLMEDARRSHRALARDAGSTQPTVTARIRRMEEAGIIQGYTLRLDDDAFGGDLDGPVHVACHWCKRRTLDPVWTTISGRRHPMCCTTCEAAFKAKDAQLRKGI